MINDFDWSKNLDFFILIMLEYYLTIKLLEKLHIFVINFPLFLKFISVYLLRNKRYMSCGDYIYFVYLYMNNYNKKCYISTIK